MEGYPWLPKDVWCLIYRMVHQSYMTDLLAEYHRLLFAGDYGNNNTYVASRVSGMLSFNDRLFTSITSDHPSSVIHTMDLMSGKAIGQVYVQATPSGSWHVIWEDS